VRYWPLCSPRSLRVAGAPLVVHYCLKTKEQAPSDSLVRPPAARPHPNPPTSRASIEARTRALPGSSGAAPASTLPGGHRQRPSPWPSLNQATPDRSRRAQASQPSAAAAGDQGLRRLYCMVWRLSYLLGRNRCDQVVASFPGRAPAELWDCHDTQTESVPSALVRRWGSFPQAPAVAKPRARARSLCLERQPPSSARRRTERPPCRG
jgi:hypothetical protein